MNELNNQLFCQMGEIANDGYFIYNTTNAKFNYINQAMASLWDLNIEVLKVSPDALIIHIHPEDREHAQSCYEECLEDMLPKKYELRLKIGPIEKYVRFAVFPFTKGDEVIICGTVEDTTAVKINKIHIEQINAHKNITLEVLSHDLKEPLGMMRLSANAMQKQMLNEGNEAMVDSLGFMVEMCERNMKLVKAMINKEFLKSSVVVIKKERADLVWELEDVVRFYRRSHLQKLREFRFKTSTDKIFMALDSMKFLQVINNLISNAIKFTSKGGIIELGLQDKHESVVISVADNGVGISDQLKPNLFNKGKQGLKPGLIGEDSNGLGMSIIKTIVELHGGLVWFVSQVNIGTTFYIELPK